MRRTAVLASRGGDAEREDERERELLHGDDGLLTTSDGPKDQASCQLSLS